MANHVGYVDVVPGSTGFRFNPTNQELVSFLYRKVVTRDPVMAAYGVLLHAYNLWGNKKPWELWGEFGGDYLIDQDLYFFSPLKRVSGKAGSRINRKIESGGTWRAVTARKIQDCEGNVLGQKRNFQYENEKDEGDDEHHGQWLLEEYSLDGTKYDHQQSNRKIVICRLKKSPRACVKNKRGNPNPTLESKVQPSKKRARKWGNVDNVDHDQEPGSSSCPVVCDEMINDANSMDKPITASEIETGSDLTSFTQQDGACTDDEEYLTFLDLNDQESECLVGLDMDDLQRLQAGPPSSEGEKRTYIDVDETQTPNSEVIGGTNHGGTTTDAVVVIDMERHGEQPLSQELPENQPSRAYFIDDEPRNTSDQFPLPVEEFTAAIGGYEDPNFMDAFLGIQQLPSFGELPHIAALGADQYYQAFSNGDL